MKESFPTREIARVNARRVWVKTGVSLKVYRCLRCDGWHVTAARNVKDAKDGRLYSRFPGQRRRRSGG